MTVSVLKPQEATPSQRVAREIRAELGRQGLNQSDLARRLGQTPVWVGTRVGIKASVPLRVEDVVEMAEALNVSVQGFLSVLLPWLDSNQQPSGLLWLVRWLWSVMGPPLTRAVRMMSPSGRACRSNATGHDLFTGERVA